MTVPEQRVLVRSDPMQPEDRRQRSQKMGIARARMFIASDLAWLDGYPVAQSAGLVHWRRRATVGGIGGIAPEVVLVDREKIRQTQFAVNKLLKNFAKALPVVTGDRSAWKERIGAILALLKQAIHGGVAVDIARTMPEALRWAGRYAPAEAGELQQIFREHKHLLDLFPANASGQPDWSLQLMLLDLVRHDGAERVAPLIEVIAHAHAPGFTWGQIHDRIRQWRNFFDTWFDKAERPGDPPPLEASIDDRESLAGFAAWLCGETRRIRRHALELFAEILPGGVLQAHREEMQRIEAFAQDVRREMAEIAAQWSELVTFVAHAAPVKERFNSELHPAGFTEFSFDLLLRNIRLAAGLKDAAAILKFIKRFPAGDMQRLVRPAILHALLDDHGDKLEHCGRNYVAALIKALSPLAAKINGAPQPGEDTVDAYMLPFEDTIERWNDSGGTFASDILQLTEGELPRTLWPVFTFVLESFVTRKDYSPGVQDAAIAVLRVTRDKEKSIQLVDELVCAGQGDFFSLNHVPDELLRAAIAMEAADFRFAELLIHLHQATGNEDNGACLILQLHQLLSAAGHPQVAARLTLQGETKPLLQLSSRIEMLHHLRGGFEPPLCQVSKQQAADNFESMRKKYPAEMWPELLELSQCTPKAPAIAARLLKKEFRDNNSVERELAALKLLQPDATDGPVAARINNLERRLHTTCKVSPRRLENLKQKLLLAAHRELLAAWLEATAGLMQTVTGGAAAPAWIETPLATLVVSGVLKLQPAFRELGVKLLRVASGNSDWNPNNEPQNQAFLSKIAARGVNMQPWVESHKIWRRVAGNGREIALQLEDDPFEMLCMGHHFGTCLSPHDFNFFSAVANAVDVNKRVLYGRDVDGRIAGRCLLAVGDEGSIVTFRTYCHDTTLDFQAMVAEVASEIARDMATVVSSAGQVSAVLAPEWYDDGSLDIGCALSNENSPVRRAIVHSAPGDIIDDLNQALSPVGLTCFNLPFVLAIPEVARRHEIAQELLRFARKHLAECHEDTRIRIALLADQCGDDALAAREIAYATRPAFIRRCRRSGSLDVPAIELLMKHAPSAAIRVLRKTRAKWVRSAADEPDYRKWLFAQAYKAIGREKLAAAYDTKLQR